SLVADVSGDVRVTLTDGTRVDIDLSGFKNLREVLTAFSNADPTLSAAIKGTATGIDIRENAAGSGDISIVALNGSHAAADLGIAGTGSHHRLSGSGIAGSASVRLDGRLDSDTLIGTYGDDTLTGGGGADVLTGGGGVDKVVETRDADFTLTDSTLTIGSDGADTLSGIEQAVLTGGDSANVI